MEHQQIVISGDEDVRSAFRRHVEEFVILGIAAGNPSTTRFYRFAAQQNEVEDRLGISALERKAPAQAWSREDVDHLFQSGFGVEEFVTFFCEKIENRTDRAQRFEH